MRLGRVVTTILGFALLGACSAPGPRSRYVAEHFRTTRTNFVYVRDRVSGHWMNRHCELRVPVARPLPDPLMTEEHGSALSVQFHDPESVKTAGLRSVDFLVRDGSRVWVIDDVLEAADVEGETSYSVQVFANGATSCLGCTCVVCDDDPPPPNQLPQPLLDWLVCEEEAVSVPAVLVPQIDEVAAGRSFACVAPLVLGRAAASGSPFSVSPASW